MQHTTPGLTIVLLIINAILMVGCSTSKTLIYEHKQTIWKAYANGKDATQLASLGENPSWIPGNKTHFAYLEPKSNSNKKRLWKADEDGKNPSPLTGFDLHSDYSWSPDGKWIAVSKFVNNNYEIFKVAVDGAGPIQLTKNTFSDQFPAWSPDAEKLAFISGRPGGINYGVFLINADGSGEKRLTPVSFQIHGYEDGRLAWSWDAKHIVFVGRWGGREEIGTIELSTGKITQITTKKTNPGLTGCYDPNWYDKYLFYFCADGLYRRDMNTGTAAKLGDFFPMFEHSRPSANASHVYFSYSSPPRMVSIQHYVKEQADLGPGKSPSIWGATLPLIP
ncbi:TolB family protein [Neptunomonas qingdaonensis]|uniref:WD40-like Beta Propeller Repeat n=1 Tax=Neptunomonas qingdaonensis TaxID=1045558 RepID=A0A1I2THY3_9GAMM|nr:PD40 domain-containing protein [Neptunomonas qingdaonensis]SFG61951.1 WD40-like Beta Propeller Repeat [Neptunomonas qingdaonensis]